MTTRKDTAELAQEEMNNASLVCKDMIERSTSRLNQYSYLTKELTNAMWGWYNIKPEDTKNV